MYVLKSEKDDLFRYIHIFSENYTNLLSQALLRFLNIVFITDLVCWFYLFVLVAFCRCLLVFFFSEVHKRNSVSTCPPDRMLLELCHWLANMGVETIHRLLVFACVNECV